MHTPTSNDQGHQGAYGEMLRSLERGFATAVQGVGRVFRTDATGLFDLYLDALPAERQLHTCGACRRFVERFGGLVVIQSDGSTTPVMWTPGAAQPAFYRAAIAALASRVAGASVTSVFLSSATTWGKPQTGIWSHMAVTPPAQLVFRERARTADQAMASARENLRTVAAALQDFKAPVLDQALRVLRAGSVDRAERFVAPVQWLRDLHDRPRGRRGETQLWLAVATAPEGYCHPRAAVTGSLIEDIAAGLPFQTIKAKFDAKVAPLAYQRPKAAPSAGNLAQAEALVEKLGLAPSLERRFARLDEVPTIWRPAPAASAPGKGSVFGHLKPKESAPGASLDLPTQTLTWEKFARTVLPTAEAIRMAPPAHGNFIALTTSVHADAPPILKWDREDERNPLAWYVYPKGSPAAQWGLSAGKPVEVTGVALLPPLMGSRPKPHLGQGVVVILKGAVDSRDAGNALFPECLKDDLHGIRASLEAYSASAHLGGRAEASACGYDLRNSAAACQLEVLNGGAWTDYRIDRWD